MKHLNTLFLAGIITFSLVSIGRTKDYDTGDHIEWDTPGAKYRVMGLDGILSRTNLS